MCWQKKKEIHSYRNTLIVINQWYSNWK